jgi:Glu-tRNA(Gln) amidotransferase subunit E-like FAD-binding protein
MRKKGILNSVKTSPYMKRLVLMERAGIKLSDKQKKKLNEVVSMVEPQKYYNRLSPTHHLKNTFSNPTNIEDLDDEDEVDLEELIDELEFENTLQEILREMGYEDDEDLLPTIDMDDLPDVSDEEMEQIIKDLEYASGEN